MWITASELRTELEASRIRLGSIRPLGLADLFGKQRGPDGPGEDMEIQPGIRERLLESRESGDFSEIPSRTMDPQWKGEEAL